MTYLRDHLAAAKLDRMKQRIADAWKARACQCLACQARRSGGNATASIGALLRALAAEPSISNESPRPDAPKH